jgi:hypothetical protein
VGWESGKNWGCDMRSQPQFFPVSDVAITDMVVAAAASGYIAAYAADRATPQPGPPLPKVETPFSLERRRQGCWLVIALSLDEDVDSEPET